MKAKQSIERRLLPMEFRVERAEGKQPKITGHAAVFNVLSPLLWGFRERIAPGAFKKTLKEADIRALFNHDSNFVLGRNAAKTLKLSEDETGLAIENTPPDTQWARDLLVSMERGDVDQMSFAFRPIRSTWEIVNEDTEDEELIVTREEVALIDVSVVTFPAYPETDAAVSRQTEHFSPVLARAMVKAQHGLRLRAVETEMLREAHEALQRYSATPGNHAAEAKSEPSNPPAPALVEPHDRRYETLVARLRILRCA